MPARWPPSSRVWAARRNGTDRFGLSRGRFTFGYSFQYFDFTTFDGVSLTRIPVFTHDDVGTFRDVSFTNGSLNVVSRAFGMKTAVAGSALVTFTLHFKLNDAGVRARITPLVGLEYVF
jgi:hypothetical protein